MASILLDTAWDPGDRDPGATYPRVGLQYGKINRQKKHIELSYEFGSFDEEDNWVPGPATISRKLVIQGPDYESIVTSTASEAGVVLIQRIELQVLQWLIDRGYLSGTAEAVP